MGYGPPALASDANAMELPAVSTGPLPAAMVCCEAIICDDRCIGACQPTAIEVDPSTGPSGSCCPGVDGTYAIDQGDSDCETLHVIDNIYELVGGIAGFDSPCGNFCDYQIEPYTSGDAGVVDFCAIYPCLGPASNITEIIALKLVGITISLTAPDQLTVEILYRYNFWRGVTGAGCSFGFSSTYDFFNVRDHYELTLDCANGYDLDTIPLTERFTDPPGTGTLTDTQYTGEYGNTFTLCDPLVLRVRA